MRLVDLEREQFNVTDLIELARDEPVLLLTADGQEFLLSEADDFEREVAALRASRAFQRFLAERSAATHRIPLDEIEREVDQELAMQQSTG